MFNSKKIFEEAKYLLQSRTAYINEEINAILFWLAEDILMLSKSQIIAEKTIAIADDILEKWQNALERLADDEPLQYILGYTQFYGRKFIVNANVLIPRPETEELVHLILQSKYFDKKSSFHCLDIGTGSGCIPITLALEMTNFNFFAIDISKSALEIAQENAKLNYADVNFIQGDILNFENEQWKLPMFDLIVSNPPYITLDEKAKMQNNVLNYEPHLALFVENQKALIFYEKIIKFSVENLKIGGMLYFEINEQFGKEIENLMTKNNFSAVQIIQDMQGKDRIVRGIYQ